ncbi:MAG: RluA family pseudouridine synthase [candidate division WOR-3 bacterium]
MPTIKQEFKRKVSEKQWGTRLDQYLYISGIGLSRSLIQKLIKQKKVLVNNKPVKCSYRVKEGDEIYAVFELQTGPEIKPENIPLDIVYEDDDIIVVNKPKGIVVHPARGHFEHTMVNALLYHCGRLPTLTDEIRPGVLHRLDKDTTGLIVFAKTDEALSKLGKALARREIQKRYDVLCWNFPGMHEGLIEAPIGRSAVIRTKMTVTPLSSKMATTKYQVLEKFPLASYLKVWLITGRTHQIRVHLNYIGCPVIGDKDYGGRNPGVIKNSAYLSDFQAILKLIDRQALHASEITFHHPRTNELLRFTVPLPEDMKRVLDYLKKRFAK